MQVRKGFIKMGYAFMIGHCLGCKRQIVFNPVRVPSLNNEPVCRECIEKANPIRIKNGLEPITIHPDAYGACDEHEL